ncbi:MAG: replication initiator protein A [Lachnospiraceae bacterium]|nr:replication initiator protein A [Lachnospiraceae bacterium]
MKFDYYYGEEADQFTFYRIPKILFTNPRLKHLSTDAKLLYGLMLDRMGLSVKNRWFDEYNRVYIIFTTEQIQEMMGSGDNKATKMMKELENKKQIERKRHGQGKAALIYVKNFVTEENGPDENRENHESEKQETSMKRENNDSRIVKTTSLESAKPRCSKTDMNETKESDTYPIPSICDSTSADRYDGMDKSIVKITRDYFTKTLCIEEMKMQNSDESTANLLDAILEILVDACTTTKQTIRIGGVEKPAEIVKGRLKKLNMFHIEYVMDCFDRSRTEIRNIRSYLLTALYNAPDTMDAYYAALVRSREGIGFC